MIAFMEIRLRGAELSGTAKCQPGGSSAAISVPARLGALSALSFHLACVSSLPPLPWLCGHTCCACSVPPSTWGSGGTREPGTVWSQCQPTMASEAESCQLPRL